MMKWHRLRDQMANASGVEAAADNGGYLDPMYPSSKAVEAAREELERRIEGIIDWVTGDGFPGPVDVLRQELRAIAGLED